jgi:hypothetical protein
MHIENYLQFFEKLFIKHWIESGEISYYKRYVDDILIIFDQNKTNENSIMNHLNNIHKYLEFKLTEEENNNINKFLCAFVGILINIK